MTRLRPWLARLLLAALVLPGAWPFLQPQLARTNDTIPHLYRAIQLDALVRAGVFFPRWAPDLVFGYGYPVFNFFPYLGHYLIVAWHALGLDFIAAYQASGVFTLVLSAWTAWALVRELGGETAGVVAGAAYAYSPYLLYDAHIRGSLPESLALALLPLALLQLRRAARGQAASVVWAGLAVAGCLLAHNGVSLQALPFVGAYGLFEAWRAGRETPPPPLPPGAARLGGPRFARFAAVLLALALAAGLSAFFWLPALSESSAAQIERGTTSGGMLYTANFLSLAELTAQPRAPVDPDLLNPPLARPLPLTALLLASAAGMLALARRPARPDRAHLLFFGAAAALAVALIHPLARPLWDTLPLLRLTLFPWRLLGPASLFLSAAAGLLFSPAPQRGPAALLPALAVCALAVTGLPFASPPFEPTPPRPGLDEVAALDMPPYFIGTTSVGEYLPRGVQQLPADSLARRDRAARARFSAPGAEVQVRSAGPYQDTFTLSAPAAVTFIYEQFYFPGWRAVLDGAAVTPRTLVPDGRMAVDLPAGSHTLTFTFGDTWPRTLGNAASLASLLAAGLWLASTRRRAGRVRPTEAGAGAAWTALAAAALGLLAFRPLLWDAGRTPFLRPGLSEAGLRGVARPLNLDFSGELTLLGWEGRLQAAGDEPIAATFYWRANKQLGVPYNFDVRLLDVAGQTWSVLETQRPRDWRFVPGTDFWPPEQYVGLPYLITPLPGTPAGDYRLRVTAFSAYDYRSLGEAVVGTVALTSASHRSCAAQPLAELGGLVLQSAEFSASQASPGDDLTASLCWSAAQPAQPAAPVELQLVDRAGQPAAAHAVALDPASWPAGAVVRVQVPVRVPAGLETGAYTWRLQAGGQSVALGTLAGTAPQRAYTPPDTGQAVRAELGPVTLWSAEVSGPLTAGAPLAVRLVWRAEAPVDDSYQVFVHLLGADGSLVAQSDSVPAQWTRRTTGWLPGEYVVDPHALAIPADLPAGSYSLSAGLYRQSDGARLTGAAFPDGRVPLTVLTLP